MMTRMAGQFDQMDEVQALQLRALLDEAGLQVVQPYLRRKPGARKAGADRLVRRIHS
jgi:hypothetical protein